MVKNIGEKTNAKAFGKGVLSSVIEFRNHYQRLWRELDIAGNFPEETKNKCDDRVEQVVLDLISAAVKIDRSVVATSSSFKSPASSSSCDESMASSLSPPERQKPPGGNMAATNASPPQASVPDLPPVLPSMQLRAEIPGQRIQNLTYSTGISPTRERGGGSFRSFNMIFNASRKINRRRLRLRSLNKRARRDAAPDQSNELPSKQDSIDCNEENDDSFNSGHFHDLMADFNATFLEQPEDLSEEDRDHESLCEIIKKTLDPLQWNLRPKTEVVRKLFLDKEVKTKILDYLLEHVRFGFHIEKSKGCLNKFLGSIVDCILPSGDVRKDIVVDYLRNCAAQTSRNFGSVIHLMLKVHEKHCSEECVRTGSLDRFRTMGLQ